MGVILEFSFSFLTSHSLTVSRSHQFPLTYITASHWPFSVPVILVQTLILLSFAYLWEFATFTLWACPQYAYLKLINSSDLTKEWHSVLEEYRRSFPMFVILSCYKFSSQLTQYLFGDSEVSEGLVPMLSVTAMWSPTCPQHPVFLTNSVYSSGLIINISVYLSLYLQRELSVLLVYWIHILTFLLQIFSHYLKCFWVFFSCPTL